METSITVPDASKAPDASGAFSALAGAMHGELKRHCYRMMGGVQDAEDCVQETLLRGWREFASLRDGAAGRPWLYSIATRVCLDALRTRQRRQTLFGPSLDEVEPGAEPWVEPWPGEVSAVRPRTPAGHPAGFRLAAARALAARPSRAAAARRRGHDGGGSGDRAWDQRGGGPQRPATGADRPPPQDVVAADDAR